MHTRSNIKFLLSSVIGLFLLFFYLEYLIYFVVQKDCSYPDLNPKDEDESIEPPAGAPVKVLVLADTHLLGPFRGHWFDKVRREWQMHRAFQTAMHLHKPELVFVLGDLTDEGLWVGDEEFDRYVERFYGLFEVPDEVRMFVAVGNHDIGFHYHMRPHLHDRFVKAFRSPPVQLISVRGNHFVLVNSMALEGDGCSFCKPVEEELTKIKKMLQCTRGTSTEKCPANMKLERYSRPILMQHFPLYRQSDAECTDFDSAPPTVKQERFRETWECLSREATLQLLNQVKPRLVLSGHTHHGCTRQLPTGDGIEVTVPSFSWRNKDNPNYLLAVFSPNNFAYKKCEMPVESTVITLYCFGITIFILWIIYNVICTKKFKYR